MVLEWYKITKSQLDPKVCNGKVFGGLLWWTKFCHKQLDSPN